MKTGQKKIHFETQQSPSFMGNPYPKIPETPLVIHLYVLDSSVFNPAPIYLISNSIWPSFDPPHRHRLLLSTRMRWAHHTDQRSQKLPQRHIDPMGLVRCCVGRFGFPHETSFFLIVTKGTVASVSWVHEFFKRKWSHPFNQEIGIGKPQDVA